MIQEYHPISLNNSSFIFNGKDKDIPKLIESVFISKLPKENISPGRFKINNAIFDTNGKLYPQIKQKIIAIGSNSATVENRGLSETNADFQNI